MPITFSNIILWRHAQAIDGINADDDMSRALTQKGQRQADKMSSWLAKNLPSAHLAPKLLLGQIDRVDQASLTNWTLYSSAALRAYQTAQALNIKANCNIEVVERFNPNSSLQKVLTELSQLNQLQNLVLVGHAPWIGQLTAHLLGAKADEFTIKKGAIWWLRRSKSKPSHYEILTVQTPKI